jgi:hypothetical protein
MNGNYDKVRTTFVFFTIGQKKTAVKKQAVSRLSLSFFAAATAFFLCSFFRLRFFCCLRFLIFLIHFPPLPYLVLLLRYESSQELVSGGQLFFIVLNPKLNNRF